APVGASAAADPPQPPIDRGVLKSLYNPVGFFKPGDPIPTPDKPPAPTGPGGVYNPSGHWSAYDSNVYESLNFPGRQAGDTTNNAGIVPGADHPEQEIIVSGHYDFTDAGPAAAWDSSEGHTEVIRIAKIMTDYWRATGTRPAVTVKFMPWSAEESGT